MLWIRDCGLLLFFSVILPKIINGFLQNAICSLCLYFLASHAFNTASLASAKTVPMELFFLRFPHH